MTQKPPTPAIERAHKEHLSTLPLDDTTDFVDADRGLIAALSPCVIKAADGRVVFWSHDTRGPNGEAWPDLAAWIEQVWMFD